MKISIFMLSIFYSLISWAQSMPSEEAIILNQEMQYLEEAAQNVQIITAKETEETETKASEELIELEQEYFGKPKTQSISTKAAAPKRRSLQ